MDAWRYGRPPCGIRFNPAPGRVAPSPVRRKLSPAADMRDALASAALCQKRTLRPRFVRERGARASRLDVVADGVEASLVGEEALSRDVVHLQPDAVGVLEQHRVV